MSGRFQKYCASGRDDENRFRGSVLGLLTDESVRWLLAILELENGRCKRLLLFGDIIGTI